MNQALRMFTRALAALSVLCAAAPAVAADWAVIMMYHRFGETAIPTTNIRLEQFDAHIEELKKSEYTVLPLGEIVAKLQAGESLPDRTVGLSVDDAFLSVYNEAWPRLKKAGLPFTLFLATDPIDKHVAGYMNWDQIREMHKAGVTIGAHSTTHAHMTTLTPAQNAEEIRISNARFKAELGEVPKLFAYPFGEYSLAMREVTKAGGYVAGFGQHSGVIAGGGDMFFLPRFAMNETFGSLSRFRLAANALPLRVRDVTPADPLLSSANNPPIIGFTVEGDAAKRLSRLNCYPSSQATARIVALGPRIEVRLDGEFPPGRARVNCTLMAPSGRWHWYGLQFYVPKGA